MILPQRWYVGLGEVVGCVDNKVFIYVWMTMDDRRFSGSVLMTVGHEGEVRIKVMKLEAGAQLPRYAHAGPFGDLAADLYAVAGVSLDAGVTLPVATGVAMEFPSSHGALVEDRSGLAVRGVTTLAGVIDPGYRGEIKVVMTNLSAAAVEIKAGDRIAQLRIVRRIEAQFDEVSDLVEAPRGAAGFGSTGS
jgi:dUTP pyrophosphatase